MSKYHTLSERFAARSGDDWRASFAELEGALGFSLPKAARAGRAWWANDPAKAHSRAWTSHGWAVGDVDLAGESVVFRRIAEAPTEVQPPVMRDAAESASARMHATRALGLTAIVTAGAALVGGLGALIARAVMRRSR